MRTIIFVTLIVFCLLVPFASPTVKKRRQKKANKLKLPSASRQDFVDQDLLLDVDGVSFKMIPITGGIFTRSKQAASNGVSHNNGAVTQGVEMPSFYIGESPVTQELWDAVMNSSVPKNVTAADLHRPVEGVSAIACDEFLVRLSAKTGRHFRRLTEDEWEFAACGDHKNTERIVRGSENTSPQVLDHSLRLALS